MSRNRPYCLTIAGFDPSGGAGVLADIKSFEQLKTLGLAVQTCNTIQVEDQFNAVVWTKEQVILDQLELLLKRYSPRFVKIGIIENSTVLLSVLKMIKREVPASVIVWDPVLSPSFSLTELMKEDRFEADLNEILESIDVVTPNIPEYNVLKLCTSFKDVKVYLKGGHKDVLDLEGERQELGTDFLLTHKGLKKLKAKRTHFLPKHGTGCILSSALCSYMARGFNFHKASVKSKDYVYKRAMSNSSLLSYHNNG